MINMILAMDLEGGIGKDGTLPWHFPEDLKRFKKLTENCIVVMGKNTWNDPKFPKPLKNRKTIVFSNNHDDIIKPTFIDELNAIKYKYIPYYVIGLTMEPVDTWVIGGATLYNQLMHMVDNVYVTLVKDTYDCDTFIDGEILNDKFELIEEEDHGDYSFNIYRNMI